MQAETHQVLIKFGAKLREYRLARQLSQEVLAELCDIDRTYLSGLERGVRNPTLTVLARIAAGLGVSLSELTSNLEAESYE